MRSGSSSRLDLKLPDEVDSWVRIDGNGFVCQAPTTGARAGTCRRTTAPGGSSDAFLGFDELSIHGVVTTGTSVRTISNASATCFHLQGLPELPVHINPWSACFSDAHQLLEVDGFGARVLLSLLAGDLSDSGFSVAGVSALPESLSIEAEKIERPGSSDITLPFPVSEGGSVGQSTAR
jgi:hypothetical protein